MNAKTAKQTISLEYDLPYPLSKVWRALTEPGARKGTVEVRPVMEVAGLPTD